MCIRDSTNCSGDASDKPGYSEIIKGRIDRSPPALVGVPQPCLLYTSDAADERSSVDLGGRRIIKKKR